MLLNNTQTIRQKGAGQKFQRLSKVQQSRPVQIVHCLSNNGQATEAESSSVLLDIQDLHAVVTSTGQSLLSGVSLQVKKGEMHALMGKNGSGKSTLAKVIVGHPDYTVTSGKITFMGEEIAEMEPEDRAKLGLFLSFQSPIEIPGVNNVDFLRMAYNCKRKAKGEDEIDPLEFYAFLQPKLAQLNIDPSFLSRNVNESFSGGERKRNEVLQMAVLEPQAAILDEIDSGLDVDAIKDVAKSVLGLKQQDNAVVLVTHQRSFLDELKPDVIHIMSNGQIISSGGIELADTIAEQGFDQLTS